MELASRWPLPGPCPRSGATPPTRWALPAVDVRVTGPQGLAHRGAGATGGIRCEVAGAGKRVLRTCKNCKKQFDPALNHPTACRFHTAHFGGETKRKFESVYIGGTMDTPDSGKVFQYWHCCGSEDPFDGGCTAAPHCSYDE